MSQSDSQILFDTLKDSVKDRFAAQQRVLSFSDYSKEVAKDPKKHLRSSVDWICDAFRFYEDAAVDKRGDLFEQHYPERFQPVFGQAEAKKKFREILEAFSKTGRSDKVIVFHGPNGSAKTTLCRNLFAALERYSQSPDGSLYTFSWVFPLQKLLGKSVGLATGAKESSSLESYAYWPIDELGAVLRSELHENPLLLFPKEERKKVLEYWQKSLNLEPKEAEYLRSRFENADLSHKNTLIYETLLSEYKGDLLQLFKHIRVERFYLSYKLRSSLAVIEPQFGVDANLRQITLDQSLVNLPHVLQSLNLYQFEGDLVAGNRGVVEYNDLLKRPLESFKYLLSAGENSRVQMGPYSMELDALMLATTNDHQLESFRDHPEYMSFRGRFEFIRVPYLLKFSDEQKIYEREIFKLKEVKEVMPHTSRFLALWAVMTRLKKPLTRNKSTLLIKVLDSLSPLEKAKIYNSSEMPDRMNEEERRELKQHLAELMSEHKTQAFYEGLLGASARELRILIQSAAIKSENKCLGPLAIIRELKHHITKLAEFEYLRMEPVGAYHNYAQLLELAHHEWVSWVDEELRSVLGMGEMPQLREVLQSYVKSIMMLLRGEKVKNRMTGKSEDPSLVEIQKTEEIFGIKENAEEFRKSILGRLGAWSVENKKTLNEVLPFEEIFPDLLLRVKASRRGEEDTKISKMIDIFASQDVAALSKKRDPDDNSLTEGERLAIMAFRGLQKEKGYGPLSALEALSEYLRVVFKAEDKIKDRINET
jgi:serine protein kinase